MVGEKGSLEKTIDAVADPRASFNVKPDNTPPLDSAGVDSEERSRPQPSGQRVADPSTLPSADIGELKKAAEDLKRRIDEAKRHNDMPIDAQLGSPDFERRAADGRFDLPEDEDE
jgi:hypothetical protein